MFGSPHRPERKLSSIKAYMRVSDEWEEVTLANVSARGLMLKGANVPPVGTKIEIRRRGLAIEGEVVWATRTRCGVRSLEEIDLSALTAPSGLQPDRRAPERLPPTTRRARARWIFWNG